MNENHDLVSLLHELRDFREHSAIEVLSSIRAIRFAFDSQEVLFKGNGPE
jgi:hypothetical protein